MRTLSAPRCDRRALAGLVHGGRDDVDRVTQLSEALVPEGRQASHRRAARAFELRASPWCAELPASRAALSPRSRSPRFVGVVEPSPSAWLGPQCLGEHGARKRDRARRTSRCRPASRSQSATLAIGEAVDVAHHQLLPERRAGRPWRSPGASARCLRERCDSCSGLGAASSLWRNRAPLRSVMSPAVSHGLALIARQLREGHRGSSALMGGEKPRLRSINRKRWRGPEVRVSQRSAMMSSASVGLRESHFAKRVSIIEQGWQRFRGRPLPSGTISTSQAARPAGARPSWRLSSTTFAFRRLLLGRSERQFSAGLINAHGERRPLARSAGNFHTISQ